MKRRVLLGIGSICYAVFHCMWVLQWEQVDFITLLQNCAFGTGSLSTARVLHLYTELAPLLIYEMIMGTEIYRHYCVAGIYDMIRRPHRKRWFVAEAFRLLGETFLFSALMIFCEVLFTFCLGKLGKICWQDCYLFIMEIVMIAFFVWIGCILINVLSMIWDSRYGFGIVALMQMGCLTLLGMFGPEGVLSFETSGIDHGILSFMLKLNPVSHIILNLHGSILEQGAEILLENPCFINFSMLESLLYMMVLSAFVMIFGLVTVQKVELIG